MEPIIHLENVNFGYHALPTLINVSLDVYQGDFVGIIGPNGGGKTTLLRLILGFLQPSSGIVKIFGESPQSSLSKVAYVPQNLHYDKLFPISVMELVLSGRLYHLPWYGIYSKFDREIAIQSLEKVGLSAYRNHSFGNLSGGQAQRALIARALASQPQLMLLDEPTASVDSQASADIYGILQKLKEEKMTILMVTHDLKTAIDQVQKIVCVQGGNVLILPPEEVCEHFTLGLYHDPIPTKKLQVIK